MATDPLTYLMLTTLLAPQKSLELFQIEHFDETRDKKLFNSITEEATAPAAAATTRAKHSCEMMLITEFQLVP
jgi:hypothetical protein